MNNLSPDSLLSPSVSYTGKDKELPSICFVAQNAFGAVSGQSTGYRQVGGIQNQIALMGQWLSEKGYAVSVVVWDEGQEDSLDCNGVTLLKMCPASKGLPGLRFVHPRMTSLYAAMKRASADIYYHNCAESVTGLVAAWCRLHRRKFVYSVAAEIACDRKLGFTDKASERMLYRFGLRNADRIIVQTQKQKEMLKAGFRLDSLHLPMPSPDPALAVGGDLASRGRNVLWVGRVTKGKRLEWLLQIAEKLTDVTFEIAGANTETDYAKDLFERAASLENVNWLGTVPWNSMPELYARSACLCCTSALEGFPNTFLEAWGQGTPTVSSFDPDSLIERRGLGLVGSTPDELKQGLEVMLRDGGRWNEASTNSLLYFQEAHQIDTAMDRFDLAFRELGA
jgi:glycosyltransferase involved in cell wall biosynthesis